MLLGSLAAVYRNSHANHTDMVAPDVAGTSRFVHVVVVATGGALMGHPSAPVNGNVAPQSAYHPNDLN